jgi:hypothetical protein
VPGVKISQFLSRVSWENLKANTMGNGVRDEEGTRIEVVRV